MNTRPRFGSSYAPVHWSLWTFSGPEARARKLASDELLDHWEAFPPPSMVAFELE
ncbi:hypothetical protein [Arthrobacter woluwensis]|uniref:hypothetical protein n=1 Tax=Arthrobacter woluwensis TaxID=156980 RepID=UPI00383085B6